MGVNSSIWQHRQHRKVLLYNLLTSRKLNDYLAGIDK